MASGLYMGRKTLTITTFAAYQDLRYFA